MDNIRSTWDTADKKAFYLKHSKEIDAEKNQNQKQKKNPRSIYVCERACVNSCNHSTCPSTFNINLYPELDHYNTIVAE
eukprot:3437889-Rhodomonas_salina.1